MPLFNFAPYNYFQRPDERYTFGTFAEYEISPGAKPYLEAMFMHDHTDAQIAPSGNFNNTTYAQLRQPAAVGAGDSRRSAFRARRSPIRASSIRPPACRRRWRIVLIGRRNVEGGGRDDDLEHTDYRIVAGIKGDLLRGLSYDAYYQFGTSRRAETYLNDFSVTRLQRAIDVIANPAVGGVAGVPAGTPVCRAARSGRRRSELRAVQHLHAPAASRRRR